MRVPPQISLLPDGRRLHLHDGPIDLIVEAFGAREQIRAAYDAAARRFVTVLNELCAELPLLRRQARPDVPSPNGVVARRMARAVAPFTQRFFITPMAAVAGAVAEEILSAMTVASGLDRAYVNNGGDIALHLSPGERFAVAMIDRPDRPSLFASATIHAADPVRGIATSGWRGRSFSLGIADAVTVLAGCASLADAAATIIANRVDLPGHPEVHREPANSIDPQTDLGSLPVTRAVGQLASREIEYALASGVRIAEELLRSRVIVAAALHLKGHTRTVAAQQAFGLRRKTTANAEPTHPPEQRSILHA
jgi:ApbE superfamily uncharacterized protein (UPF0280 family)